jgi:hypothetical protein
LLGLSCDTFYQSIFGAFVDIAMIIYSTRPVILCKVMLRGFSKLTLAVIFGYDNVMVEFVFGKDYLLLYIPFISSALISEL